MPSDPDVGSKRLVPLDAELVGSSRFARRLLATLPGLVYLCDLRDGRNAYLGQDLAEWLGHKPGSGAPDLAIHPDDAEAVRTHHARLAGAADEALCVLEFRVRHADGGWHWLRSREVVFLRDAQGVPVQTLGTFEDFTSERDAREKLQASEELFSRAFHLSPDSININRLEDGVYLDINEGFTQITGYTREDVVGRPSTSADLAVWVDDADRARLVAGLKANGEVTGLEAKFRRKDGSVLDGLMSARIMEIHGEKVLLSISRDITERKRAEEALRASEATFRLLVEQSHDIIFTVTSDGRFAYLSPAWTRVLGHPIAAALGRPFQPYVHPEDVARCEEAVRSIVEGELPALEVTYRARHLDGTWRWITATLGPVADGEGRSAGVQGSGRDLTRQTQLEAELHQAQKLESLGSLAGGIAHDMNNVLAAIQAVTETLKFAHAGQGPLVKALETIEKASTRGRDLVRSLTNFARKDLREPELLDLNALVREEVELLRRTTLQKVELAVELEPDLPAVVGERGSLGSALMNLCVNALDAMPRGGTLAIRTRRRPGARVELTVADTGQGMSAAVLARAMEPYYTTKPQGKGTGLGLAMVYATAKAHGGSVALASEEGRGTSVVLTLPASGKAGAAAAGAEAAAPSAGPMSILLVDDDELIRASVPPMVEFFGHRVVSAAGGREALQYLKEGQGFDLVILDLNMPGMDGLETLRHLRRLRPDLPVLLATGRLDDATVSALRKDGKALGIFKPFSMAELDLKFKVLETLRHAGAAGH